MPYDIDRKKTLPLVLGFLTPQSVRRLRDIFITWIDFDAYIVLKTEHCEKGDLCSCSNCRKHHPLPPTPQEFEKIASTMRAHPSYLMDWNEWESGTWGPTTTYFLFEFPQSDSFLRWQLTETLGREEPPQQVRDYLSAKRAVQT